MINNKFAVIGLGQFGTSIARALANRGAEVLAIDNCRENVEAISDKVAHAVMLDATDEKALRSQNIEDVDAVVVAIGEDFESLLLTTVMLLDLNIKRIIARAANLQQRKILEKVGVKEILSPEEEVGKTVAKTLINPGVHTALSLPDDYEIVEVNTPKRIANRTIADIALRQKYNLNLITIKRKFEEDINGETIEVEHIIGVPRGDTTLYESDTIIVMGKSHEIEKFIEINE